MELLLQHRNTHNLRPFAASYMGGSWLLHVPYPGTCCSVFKVLPEEQEIKAALLAAIDPVLKTLASSSAVKSLISTILRPKARKPS